MNLSQLDRLRNTLRHAYNHAPAVRTIFERADLTPDMIQNLDDLDKIPVTSKDRLAELQQSNPPFGGFLTTPIDKLQHVFLSPGPLYEPHTGDSPVIDSIREVLIIAGFKSGDVVLNTFGYHLIPTGLAVDQILREMGATVIPAGVGNAELQIKMMLDLGVTGYVGTPSWLAALIQKADDMGMDFQEQFTLQKALVSAEPLPPSLRQTFVDRYDLRVANAYGTAELGFLACDTEGAMAMRLLESSIIQIANPETGQSVGPGEVGEVVVTTFNKTYPLIRLGTGDLAMNIDPDPGNSSQGERSAILVGRVGDAVKVRGMFIHPNQLNFALAQVPGIAGYQAVVNRSENRDSLTLRMVLSDSSTDQDALTATLSAAIQATCRVKPDQFEFVAADDILDDAKPILDLRDWA
ncbi:MAG: AMP-binding protein [Chloroflexi bacterium]|nr:AMP-binding protein [Chloroflexota bacterium]